MKQAKNKMTGDDSTPLKIPLTGKLITQVDPVGIGSNFQMIRNLRYTDTHLRGIGGMTKFNTSTIDATYYKTRSAIYFRKSSPVESHLIAQVYNSGETASKIFTNDTSISYSFPQGNFSTTTLHTDATGASIGIFSDAPDGCISYCNGVETLIWGGNEYRCPALIIGDLSGNYQYDYSDKLIQNDPVTGAVKTSIILSTIPSSIDSNTKFLLHCNGTNGSTVFTDSSTYARTFTSVNGANLSNAQIKFGSASGFFGGTNQYITTPLNTDLSLNNGSFCIDTWAYTTSLSAVRTIISHGTDSNRYWKLQVNTDGSVTFEHKRISSGTWAATTAYTQYQSVYRTGGVTVYFFEVLIAGTSGATEPTWPITEGGTVVDGTVTWVYRTAGTVTLTTISGLITINSWNHIEIDETGNDYRLFINGIVYAGLTSSLRILQMYVNPLVVGALYDGTLPFAGYIDECRYNTIVRHTADFIVQTSEYSNATSSSGFFIGAVRPLTGFKLYSNVPNTNSSTMTVSYWNGTSYTNVTNLVDGTISGGASLGQTGTVSFDDTINVSKPSNLNGKYLYWYYIAISSIVATTAMYFITVKENMQPIKDLWDGTYRLVQNAQLYVASTATYYDHTLALYAIDYTSANTISYSNIGAMTPSDAIYLGFGEQMTGLSFTMAQGYTNSTAGKWNIYYWNGLAWTLVNGIQDGTHTIGSCGKTGVITWNYNNFNSEFKTMLNDEIPLYYYKLVPSATLSNDVRIDYIGGITAPKSIDNYKFPVYAHNRLMLCSPATRQNSVLIGSIDSTVTFNGKDSTTLNFGDNYPLTAGESVFAQYGASLYKITLFFKEHQTWTLSGNSPSDFQIFQISSSIGCVAPHTLKKANINYDLTNAQNRYIVLWQGSEGLYMSDGKNITPISTDISDIFNIRNANGINRTMIKKSVGFFDEYNQEYHWLWASGSSSILNKEYVFDLKRQKWYEVNRGAATLSYGCKASDSNGDSLNIGFIDTGYAEYLESGNNFDGGTILHEFQLGDMALWDSDPLVLTQLEKVILFNIAKTITTNNITMTYTGDSSTTSSTYTLSPSKANFRVATPIQSINHGPYSFHNLKFSLSTTNEVVGFEPMLLTLTYKKVRLRQN